MGALLKPASRVSGGTPWRRLRSPGVLFMLALGVLLAVVMATIGSAATPHAFRSDLSQSGLSNPCGVATDSQGNLYVGNYGTNTVRIYDPTGVFVTEFSASSPCGLAVDSAGNVYVNSYGAELVKYKPGVGEFPPTPSTTYSVDTAVNGTGTVLSRSNGVAVNPVDQNVYATILGVNEVQSVNRNGATGGSYKLCKGDEPTTCTTSIANNANGLTTATRLAEIFGTGNVAVTGAAALNPKPVTFQGALANTPIPLMICDGSGLTGGPTPGTCTASRTTAGSPSRVSIFQPDGTPVSASTGTGVAGASYYGVDVYGANGDVYALDVANDKAYVFEPDGDLKHTITGAGTPAGSFGNLNQAYLAVDQANGHVLIGDVAANGVVNEFDETGVYDSQIGPTFGGSLTFQDSAPTDIAVDRGSSSPNDGFQYVTSGTDPGASNVYAFAPIAPPSATTGDATNVTQTSATLHAEVNPNGGATSDCRIEWGPSAGVYTTGSAPCSPDPETASSDVAVTVSLAGLTPHAIYHYRAVITTPGGTASGDDEIFVASTPPAATTGAATDFGPGEATVNGTVNPAGGDDTTCEFEYGPTTAYGSTAPCDPNPGSSTDPVDVSADLTGLSAYDEVHYRVVITTDGGVANGADRQFTGAGEPTLTHIVSDATHERATVTALINPHNQDTSYQVEWGPTVAYGNTSPIPAGDIGAGDENVGVSETLEDLDADTTYHFRIIAVNAAGTATSQDYVFTTDRTAGRTGNRVPELVSPTDKGAGGHVGYFSGEGNFFQASADGDSVFYPLAYGLPGATAFGVVRYKAQRGTGDWSSSQATPPITVTGSPTSQAEMGGGLYQFLARDLSCGVLNSPQPLTGDAPTEPNDNGGTNLFRSDENGNYTLMSPQAPVNVTDPAANDPTDPWASYHVAGASPDCKRVVFDALYRFAGLNGSGLYESEDGVLRDIGVLPDGSAAPMGPAGPNGAAPVIGGGGAKTTGGGERFTYISNRAVSEDASRVYFTAVSNDGNDAGQPALYLREDGTTTKVSASKTSVGTRDAYYQTAAVDGSKVAFMANYGLADTSRTTPVEPNCSARAIGACALYIYDVDSGGLVDISATSDPANTDGPEVVGVVAASDDLSRIYFVARGQLVAGEGRTHAQNVAGQTAGLYLWDEGTLRFVAPVSSTELHDGGVLAVSAGLLARAGGSLRSQTTPDGSSLLFSTSADVVGYDPGGVPAAYVYSAESGQTVCVSCRRDGDVSLGGSAVVFTDAVIINVAGPDGDQYANLRYARSLSEDGKRVFFSSRDALTDGAVEGNQNVYVWDDGVVRLLITGPFETVLATLNLGPVFMGASDSGDDAFIRTPAALDPSDVDGVNDLYDFRVDGREPTEVVHLPSCNVLMGDCQTTGPSPFAPFTSTVTTEPEQSGQQRGRVSLARLSRSKLAALANGRRIEVKVRVSGVGKVRVRGVARIGPKTRTVFVGGRSASRAGLVDVPVRLSRVARGVLGQRGRLRVGLEVSFSKAARSKRSTLMLERSAGSKRTASQKRGGRS